MLVGLERPQDVYSTVLDLVENFRESEENTNEIAKILKGHVKRKVIKQTVSKICEHTNKQKMNKQ